MPKFGVYGDRSLVVIDRADLRDPTSPYRARSFTLSADGAERMWELISDGQLTGGGAHAAGTREGVADGGGLVFETEIGGEITYVHAPFLDEPDNGTRGALYDLVTMFGAYAEEPGTELPLNWVMVGDASPNRTPSRGPLMNLPEVSRHVSRSTLAT